MAGFTGFSVGLVNNHSVMIPIPTLVANSPRVINKDGRTWARVLRVTGQPNAGSENGNKCEEEETKNEKKASSWFFPSKK